MQTCRQVRREFGPIYMGEAEVWYAHTWYGAGLEMLQPVRWHKCEAGYGEVVFGGVRGWYAG